MNEQEIEVLVKVGETVLPLVKVGVSAVLAFARQHGGKAETIAQLTANQQTIEGDGKTIDQELDDLDKGEQ